MNQPGTTHNVGDWVKPALPPGHDCFITGRVVSRETYEDSTGSRTMYEVRWINADGKPDHEPHRHRGDELRAATTHATP